MKTNIERLRERIEQNYREYKADMLAVLDGELFFDMAGEIAAVQDVYELSQDSGWIDEGEAAYLLEFAEPLKMLADAWEEFLFEGGSEFKMVVGEVLDSNDNTVNYITTSYTEELKRKYGADVYIKDALFSELLATGKKFTLLKNMLDEGVDLCFDEE